MGCGRSLVEELPRGRTTDRHWELALIEVILESSLGLQMNSVGLFIRNPVAHFSSVIIMPLLWLSAVVLCNRFSVLLAMLV